MAINKPKLVVQNDSAGPLPSGGGGDTFDPMEARVARLETDMSESKSDMKKALADLAWLRGRAEAAPTTWQLVTLLAGQFVGLAGLIIAALKFAK